MARIPSYIEVQQIEGEDILLLTDASNLNATKTTNVDDLAAYIGDSDALAGLITTYVHEQSVPSATWEIEHNLEKFPSVSIVDNYNRRFEGEVTYTDENNIVVVLTAAITGNAYLN